MPTHEQDQWVAAAFGIDPASYAAPAPFGSRHGATAPGEPGLLASAAAWAQRTATDATDAISAFDDAHHHVLTRAVGAAQMLSGAAEAVAGAALAGVGGAATGTGVGAAPGIPAMIGGVALAVNGTDNAQTGLRTLLTGEAHHTAISDAAGAGARALGASDAMAARITSGVDLTQGIAGGAASVATGLVRRSAIGSLATATKGQQAAAEAAEAERIVQAAKGERALAEAAEAQRVTAAQAASIAVAERLQIAAALSKAPVGSPERAKLLEDFVRQSTHEKPPPTRVVLGKWVDEGKGNYIDDANAGGGVYYETPEGSHDLIGDEAAWESNALFLRQQLQSGISRLEFTNMHIETELAEEAFRKSVDITTRTPARVKEIRFLQENAAAFGYKQVGDAFVKVR